MINWNTKIRDIPGLSMEFSDDLQTSEMTLLDILTHRTGMAGADLLVVSGYPDNMTSRKTISQWVIINFYFDKSEARSKYWQHVSIFYNLDVTRRFDLSHLPPICVHIMYERQLLQGLTLAIVNFTPASRCVYIFRLMWYICVGCISHYKNMLFLMYFNAFSRRYHGWGMKKFPKRRMSADTPCVNNSYSARLWFTITDVNQITYCFPSHFIN